MHHYWARGMDHSSGLCPPHCRVGRSITIVCKINTAGLSLGGFDAINQEYERTELAPSKNCFSRTTFGWVSKYADNSRKHSQVNSSSSSYSNSIISTTWRMWNLLLCFHAVCDLFALGFHHLSTVGNRTTFKRPELLHNRPTVTQVRFFNSISS